MKKVSIINIKNKKTFQNISENPTDWIADCIINNYWGKPERWVRAKELMENGNPEEPEHWMWHSEYYEDSDVLQSEERISENTGESSSWVLLKSEYTIEIINLDNDYEWLLSECHRKRKAEYPPITELGDSLYWKENGDPSKYDLYIKKCDEVKKKYPLPIKE
jgi:hypothetical protein